MKNKIQSKWSVIATYLILVFVARIQTVALDLQLVAKVPAPTNQIISGISVIGYKDNGSVLIKLGLSESSKNLRNLGVCISKSGLFAYFEADGNSESSLTNIFEIKKEDGKSVIYVDEIISSYYTSRVGTLILKTLSPNGYISDALLDVSTRTNRYKIVDGVVDVFSVVTIGQGETHSIVITKYDSNNKAVDEKTIPTLRQSGFSGLGFFLSDLYDVNSNNHMFASIKDGFIEVYRVVDDELLPTNTISVSSKTTQSMTVSVINQDRFTLRMQTSTNLTDWNNVKSSPANKYLNVEMPAEGEKKFLRIVK